MKKNIWLLVVLAVVPVLAQAAVFTVYNKSSKDIHVAPLYDGQAQAYEFIRAGASKQYDSGMANLTGIKWNRESGYGTIPLKVHRFNLGGVVNFLEEGYTYNFGLDCDVQGMYCTK